VTVHSVICLPTLNTWLVAGTVQASKSESKYALFLKKCMVYWERQTHSNYSLCSKDYDADIRKFYEVQKTKPHILPEETKSWVGF
jgi:hypothetical protein